MEKRFIIYGKRVLEEVINAGRRKIFATFVTKKNSEESLFVQSNQKKLGSVRYVSPQELDNLTQFGQHQGIACEVSGYPYVSVEEIAGSHPLPVSLPPQGGGKLKSPSPLVGEGLRERGQVLVALDSIQDPQNFGTLCRSAACFGVSGFMIPKDRSVEVTAVVSKASAGLVEHLKVAQVTNLSQSLLELKEKGFWVYGTIKEGGEDIRKFQPPEKMVLVLGNEEKGLRPLIEKACDGFLTIPMKGSFDSLNVAQAGTVCFYELTKSLS